MSRNPEDVRIGGGGCHEGLHMNVCVHGCTQIKSYLQTNVNSIGLVSTRE